MRLLTILGLAGLAYYLYTKSQAQPSVSALPSDASVVQQTTLAGVPVTVYEAASGFYVTAPVGSSGNVKIYGPYTTAQASLALNVQKAIAGL